MIIRYILTETIDYVKERFNHKGASIGYWLRFEGSGESFYISDEQPDLHAGDRVKITLEKVTT